MSWLSGRRAARCCVAMAGFTGRHVLCLLVLLTPHVLGKRPRNCKDADVPLERRERQASTVFTGKVELVWGKPRPPGGGGDGGWFSGQVRVKAVYKGDRSLERRVVMVEGLGDSRICHSRPRVRDSRIFFTNVLDSGHLRLNSSLLRITLRNLEETRAAVRDVPYKARENVFETACERKYCPHGALCKMDDYGRPYCRCPTTCPTLFTPVCGTDGATYANHCLMRRKACQQKTEIRVRHSGECGIEAPRHRGRGRN